MKPAEAFSVIVRTIGLLVCLGAGAILFSAFINLVLGGPASVVGLAVVGVPAFLVGMWLLRGAPQIIAFAFPEREREKSYARWGTRETA